MAADRILVMVLARVRTDVERAATRLRDAADAVRAELGITEPARLLSPAAASGAAPDANGDAPGEHGARPRGRTLSNGVGVGGIDLVVEIAVAATVDVERLATAVGAAFASVHDDIDPLGSTVVIGPERRILGGPGPVELVYCMFRAATVTHAEFRAEWLTHAELARHTPGVVGYRQLHCDLGPTRRANDAAGFDPSEIDGVALLCFTSAESFVGAQQASTDFSQQARASELRFNDPARAVAVLTHERT